MHPNAAQTLLIIKNNEIFILVGNIFGLFVFVCWHPKKCLKGLTGQIQFSFNLTQGKCMVGRIKKRSHKKI